MEVDAQVRTSFCIDANRSSTELHLPLSEYDQIATALPTENRSPSIEVSHQNHCTDVVGARVESEILSYAAHSVSTTFLFTVIYDTRSPDLGSRLSDRVG